MNTRFVINLLVAAGVWGLYSLLRCGATVPTTLNFVEPERMC